MLRCKLGKLQQSSYLILGLVSNESLGVSEGNIAGSGPVALVVGDDLHLAVLEDSHTGVGGAQVNAHCLLLSHLVSCFESCEESNEWLLARECE